MSDDTQGAEGLVATPRGLKSVVLCHYLSRLINSPLPERLTELLKQLDVRGRDQLPPDVRLKP